MHRLRIRLVREHHLGAEDSQSPSTQQAWKVIELIERRLDQQCIVHGGADTDPVLGGEAARYP